MKNWWYYFLVLVSVWACQKKEVAKVTDSSSGTPQLSPPLTLTKRIDTTYYTQYLFKRGEYDYMNSQVELKVGDDTFKAVTEGYSLNDSSLTETLRDSADGELKSVRIMKAHNHVYKIKLSKNGEVLFDKKFTKHDFLKLENDGFIIESVPMAAQFRGVTLDGRVLFDIWFGLPDSDFGGISFFSTDLKGNLLQLESYSSTGGNGCDGEVHTSPNRKYFLNCHTLFGPGNYKFKFGKEDMVAAKFLTDTTFFALYDYVERYYNKAKKKWEEKYDRKTKNLIFYHVNGKKIAEYRYDGFYNELDYALPMFWLDDQHQVYFMDEEKKRLHTFSATDPTDYKVIPLNSINSLKKRPVDSTLKEVLMDRTFLGKNYYFYFSSDTLKSFFVKTT
ncbi:hypothetical protein [Rufibacter sp. LB8]|nr:hypothetical protein [Rufibacter sp. LB8]